MRRRELITLAAVLCALAMLLAGCGSSSSSSSAQTTSSSATSSASATASTTSSGPAIGFEGVPLEQGPALGSAATTGTATVDGISCKPVEQLAYHIHARLTVFDGGRAYALPGGIGIPGSQLEQSQYGPVAAGGRCYYWLHTHTSDGVIHIESPTRAIYTLGDFFDVWRQPLTGDRIAGLHGKVTAFVNGKPWHKNPREIPLLPHADIQLEIGEPIPPLIKIDWGRTQL
ncbi:MAG: hypothetical protein ACR2NR_10135 [Solirubrobacteraceae bacterium]